MRSRRGAARFPPARPTSFAFIFRLSMAGRAVYQETRERSEEFDQGFLGTLVSPSLPRFWLRRYARISFSRVLSRTSQSPRLWHCQRRFRRDDSNHHQTTTRKFYFQKSGNDERSVRVLCTIVRSFFLFLLFFFQRKKQWKTDISVLFLDEDYVLVHRFQ